MPDVFQKLFNQFLDVWKGLDSQKRFVFVAVLGVLVVGLGAGLIIATKPHYVMLFEKQLTDREAAQVAARLKEWRVPFKYDDSGIMVPVGRRRELITSLAGEDLDFGEKGFKLFSSVNIGEDDFSQKVKFRRAQEEEVTKLIKVIDGIEDVDLNISMPEKTLYYKEQQPVTASVVLTLRPGLQLSKKQILSVRNLVAGSLEGLSTDKVFITDNYGMPLVIPGEEGDDETQMQAQQLWFTNKITREMETKVMFGLSRFLTMDRVIVMANVDVDYDHIEKHSEQYRKPGFDQLKISDEEREIHMEGLGVKPGGVPGVSSNVASYQEISQQPLKYDEKERRTNWLADKDVTKIIKSPAVRRLTTSVVVDGFWKVERSLQGRVLTREYVPPSKEELETIETIVRNAVGFDQARNDDVKVRHLQYDRSRQFAAEDTAYRKQRLRMLIAGGALGAVLLLFMMVFGFYKYREWQRRRAEELARQREEALTRAAPALIEAELAAEERQRREMVERIRRTAIEKPELVASVLRSWLFAEE